jgi:hypothetical protein
MDDEGVHGGTMSGRTSVSFSDVVRAHYAWDQQTNGERLHELQEDSPARGLFDDKLRRFEKDAGEIVDAYWCRKQASAVALTRKHVPTPRRLGRGGPRGTDEYRLFRVSDWVTADAGGIANVLHECDVLAIKAANGLEGIQEAVVMQWLQAVEAHVLGFVERHRDGPPTTAETTAFITQQRRELSRIEDYYQHAGEKRARLQYVNGMLLGGVPAVVVLAGLLALVLLPFDAPSLKSDGMREFYVALAAGAAGAVISVLMRMSKGEHFTIDHELGSRGVFRLGTYRPLIGAVSGVAIFFLVQTPMLSIDSGARTFQFYASIGFLAGFSERWTQVTLSGAMRTVGDDPEERPGAKAAPAGKHPPA